MDEDRRNDDGGKGERISYGIADSPVGRMLVAATQAGVCAISFGRDDELVAALRAKFPRAEIVEHLEVVGSHIRALSEYLRGARNTMDLPLDVHPSAFQKKVWEALREIPYGETRSYKEVAQMIGEPAAVRAVARACAANPVAVAIPCHRVVRTGGGLGGYRWGLPVKEALLRKERDA